MSHAHFNDPAHIRAFLAGQLPPEAVAAFEQALRDDPALAQQVETERLAQLAGEVLIRQQLRAQMRQWAQQPPATPAEPALPPAQTFNGKWVAAAGLLVLAAMTGYFFWPRPERVPLPPQPPVVNTRPDTGVTQPPTPNPETNPAPPPRPQAQLTPEEQTARLLHVKFVPLDQRDASAPSQQLLDRALEANQNRQYDKVLRLIPANSPDTGARFLRANALFEMRQYAQAAKAYGAISADLLYGADAQFNQMLCYRAQGTPQHQAFLKALQALAEQGDPRAVRLQREIQQ